jgi:hypothetical protein
MRLRIIALGCALTGSIGFLALPQAAARADSMVQAAGARATLTLRSQEGVSKATKPQLSVSSPVTDNRYGTWVRLTVTLRRTSRDRQVSLYATPVGAARRLVGTGKVNAKGKWYQSYPITRKTTFTAVFAGNAHNPAKSASITLQAYARVANRMTGFYTTRKTSKGIVYVYHQGGTLTLYSTVTPNKHGECLEPETQQYDKGVGWHADTKYGCDSLDSASHDVAPFSLSEAKGASYRIRGDYLRRGNDTANLDEQGPWLYFTVTK